MILSGDDVETDGTAIDDPLPCAAANRAPVGDVQHRWLDDERFQAETPGTDLAAVRAPWIAEALDQMIALVPGRQVIAFSGLILFVIPTVMLEQTGGAWTPLLNRPWVWNNVLMQVLAVPAILGLSAVQEVVTRRPSGRHYCPNRGLTMLANGEPNW